MLPTLPTLPTLPNEVWHKIIASAALTDDPSEHSWIRDWLPFRQVSESFRANTAQAYLGVFLAQKGRCIINFSCGRARVQGEKYEVGLEMVYLGRDPNDQGRIVFKEKEEPQGVMDHRGEHFAKAYEEKKYGIWSKKMEAYLGGAGEETSSGRLDLVPYVISIYGVSLDSELPGLRYDVDEREISFKWEGMLDAFVLERVEVDRRILEVDPDREFRHEAVMGLFGRERGKLELARMALKKWRADVKDVRRHRIAKPYRKQRGVEMSLDMTDLKHEKNQVFKIMAAEYTGVGLDGWDDGSEASEEENEEEEGNEDGEAEEDDDDEEVGGGDEGRESDDEDDDYESDDGIIHVHVPTQYIS